MREEEDIAEIWYSQRGEYICGGTGPNDSLLYVRCTFCQAELKVSLAKDSVTCELFSL